MGETNLTITRRNWHPIEARRAMRAFAQAGFEIFLAIGFLLFSLILLVIVDRYGPTIKLASLEGRVTMNFWEWEPDRLDRTLATLKEVMPHGSSFEVLEVDEHPEPHFNQTIIVEVKYRNLTGILNWSTLWSELWFGTDGHRGASSSEIISVSGPSQLAAAFVLHLVLIPWLLLRFWRLPRECSPAKPLLPTAEHRGRLFALCITGGIVLGLVIPATFGAAEHLGLLHFSDRMPGLDTLGVTSGYLWQAALLIALAGAMEEAFFRGLLLRRFVQNGLPLLGVLVCALWFTAIHFAYFSWDSGNIAYAVWIATIGLGLGLLTLRLGTWVPAAITHASYNFAVIALAGLTHQAS